MHRAWPDPRPRAAISLLSVAGINGAFVALNDAYEIGSPGSVATIPKTLQRLRELRSDMNSPIAPRPARVNARLLLSGTADTALTVAISNRQVPVVA